MQFDRNFAWSKNGEKSKTFCDCCRALKRRSGYNISKGLANQKELFSARLNVTLIKTHSVLVLLLYLAKLLKGTPVYLQPISTRFFWSNCHRYAVVRYGHYTATFPGENPRKNSRNAHESGASKSAGRIRLSQLTSRSWPRDLSAWWPLRDRLNKYCTRVTSEVWNLPSTEAKYFGLAASISMLASRPI